MSPILTSAAMRSADRETIETFGIPGFTLMETAGREAAREIEARWGAMPGRRVLCLCGKGNNGGDGYVVARVLHARGAQVAVGSMAGADHLPPDAGLNLRLLEQLVAADPERMTLFDLTAPDALAAYGAVDLIVDALLGTGLTRALSEPYQRIADWINATGRTVVALDIPSGLNSDTGAAQGSPVRANGTVTMGALKAGLLLGDGPDAAGWIQTVDIGIPPHILARAAGEPGCARLTTDAAVRALLPTRARNAYKYSVGTALVVAGSVGFTGAAAMASLAAARSGAGAVICASPARAQAVLAVKLTDIMTAPLPANADGIESDAAIEALAGPLEKARAILVGPGLGRHPGTRAFVKALLRDIALPAVIDADGLFALAEMEPEIAALSAGRWILTPHQGEFRRLAGRDVDFSDRIALASAYAQRWQSVLILKGMPSVVGAPDGSVYINGTGNPLLATAGTGDVLAGLCTGFLAQGLSPLHAALCALHLGGAAADRHAESVNPRAMMASDLVDQLPYLFRTRFSLDS
ncbi:MAG: NAD(P)H-hydrate dehydratase [Rhodothermales bacterium]